MAEISAAAVMKLRKMSGQGMMDCKKALGETDGNVEEAMMLLRKKGLATLAKRAGRDTNQGVVYASYCPDGNVAVLVGLCCETDFVAKSDDFRATAKLLGDYAMRTEIFDSVESLMEVEYEDKKFGEVLTDLVSKTGEKTEVGFFQKYRVEPENPTEFVSFYTHFNSKVGAMVMFECDSAKTAANKELQELGKEVAMHIVAVSPLALDKSGIDQDLIAQEKAIYADQVKDKPANMIDRIIEGKLNKFLADRCLLSQPFVKDDSKTVEKAVADAGKAAGGTAKIKQFVRFSVE